MDRSQRVLIYFLFNNIILKLRELMLRWKFTKSDTYLLQKSFTILEGHRNIRKEKGPKTSGRGEGLNSEQVTRVHSPNKHFHCSRGDVGTT